MSFDTHKNFAIGTIATPPSPATSGTTLSVLPGEGQFFAANMPVTVVPAGQEPTFDNAEIGYVTAVAGDQLTVLRGQEDSIAKPVGAGWRIFGSITAKTITDIEAAADAAGVTSVNGQTGTVTLDADDISDASTTNKFTTAAEKTKLSSIAPGATANDTDANLKNRANHTGTQTAATISDFTEAAQDAVGTALSANLRNVGVTSVQTGNFTAVANNRYSVDTTTGNVTVTLPGSANLGDVLFIQKSDASANILYYSGTINGSSTSTFPIRLQQQSKLLQWDGVSSWNVIGGELSLPTLDYRYVAVNGQIAFPVTTKTATYSIGTNDVNILADATTVGFTLTLPQPSAAKVGAIYWVEKVDATVNEVTVQPYATETISGAPYSVLANCGSRVGFMTDGTNWSHA